MSEILKRLLAEQGYETDPMARVMQEETPAEPVQQPVQVEEVNPVRAQLEELSGGVAEEDTVAAQLSALVQEEEDEAGLGDVFGYYAVEPFLGIAQILEEATDGFVNLDEDAALAFREAAQGVIAERPLVGTATAIGGALVGVPGLSVAGQVAGKGAKALGAGKRTQRAVDFGTTGATYGALIPELEEGDDSTAETVLGGSIGAALGLATGGKFKLPNVKRAEQMTPKPAPEVKPKTKVGRALQATSEGLDYLGGALSTRIGMVSPRILGRLRELEHDARSMTSETYGKVENFVTGMNKIKGPDKVLLDKALLNGDHDVAIEVLKRNDARLLPEFYKAKKVLEGVRENLVKAGYDDLGKLENYWPRLVKDYDGLLSALGAEKKNAIQRALREYAQRKNISEKEIPTDERSNVIGLVLRGFGPQTIKTKSGQFAKGRTVDDIDDDLLPYYATPEESLEFYLRSTAHNIAKNKFLGKHADKDNSVQSMMDELMESGKLSSDDASTLIPMLQARLIQGEMAPGRLIQGLRDFGYATTIANPLSALVQLGDIAQSAILNGFRNTVASMFGKKGVTIDDIGLRDTIIQELDNSHKALEKLFRISGFKRIDKLGKEVFINSAFRKSNRNLQTEAGTARFRAKWKEFYGDDVEEIIADLRNGNVTDKVKFHLFNELSGIQPISLIEMPELYLRVPNGRIFYALKSFTLKQYDLLRREVVQEYKRGNRAEAIKMAARYGIFMSLAGGSIQTIRDMMTGQITDTEELAKELPNQFMWETISALGFSKYASERYLERGDFTGFAQNLLTPPTPLFDAAAKEVFDVFSENRELDVEPIAKTVPVVGPAIPLLAMWYNFMFGGFEDYLEKRDASNE